MPNPIADFPWQYDHVTGSEQVFDREGVLHNIVVNGITAIGDVTVYDNPAAAGNVIAVIHLDVTYSVSVQPITLSYDVGCKTGLYLAFEDGCEADLTVSYM